MNVDDFTIQYRVVTSDSVDNLVLRVSEVMDFGWIPVGGIAIRDNVFYQAMTFLDEVIKELKNDE